MPKRSLSDKGVKPERPPLEQPPAARGADALATARVPGDGSQRLLNFKHELFARAVGVKNTHPTEAWRSIYDPECRATEKKARDSGNRLRHHPAVTARIQYLTDQAILRDIESNVVTREWIEGEMVSTYHGARNDGQWAAAVKALELCGVDKGMYVRRTSVQKTADPIDATNREELVEQFVRLARDAFGPIDSGALRAVFAKATGVTIEIPAQASDPEPEEDTIGETAGSA